MPTRGLTTANAVELKSQYGDNLIPHKEQNSVFSILFSQFKSPLIYILLIVGAISLIFQEYLDAGLIVLVTTANVILGFFQEYSAKNTLTALKNILQPTSLVIRDGKRTEIQSHDLVPGDYVVLGSGDRIPADGQVVEGTNLLVSEAILTGEEEAVIKNTTKNTNFLFMGTIVLSGNGIMEVTQIGAETEMGKIGKNIGEIKEIKTPLQIKLEKFAKNMATIILAICVLVFILGIIRGENPFTMFRMAIILSIAAIPEGLSISLTMILALGMRRILKKKGLVKTLLSIETLGSTSVICTDKTGTLTEGKMKVVKTNFSAESPALLALTLDNEQRSSLEIALWDYVKHKKHLDPQKIFSQTKRLYQEPFDSTQKYSMTINEIKGNKQSFLLGAPEVVLSFCHIESQDKQDIAQEIQHWAEEGLRILAVATKTNGDLKAKTGFSWLGIIGVADPIRKEVSSAITTAQNAGIKIKIVTGDYRATAENCARNLGFVLTPNNVMEGKEIDSIADDLLRTRIEEVVLFTRVTPQHKLKIVKLLQEKGEVVAMTGDGVNDAPALKQANIGISVGNASDVAKEASDLILLDNNFKTIVECVKEGRLVFSNIQKTIGYVLSNSFDEIFVIVGATILGFPPPLIVAQILWVNLICDGPIDLSLAYEPQENALMLTRPQEIQEEAIFSNLTKYLIIAVSTTAGSTSLVFFWYFGILHGNLDLGRTMAFTLVASVSLVYVFAYKNLHRSILQTEKFFHNKFMFIAIFFGLLLVILSLYLPFFNRALSTVPLRPLHLILVLGATLFTTLIVELTKLFSIPNWKQNNLALLFPPTYHKQTSNQKCRTRDD